MYALSAVATLAVFAVLIALNTLVFRALFGLDYLTWYVKNTSPAFLGFAFISLAWGGLEKHTDLIAAHPLKFVRGYFVLCSGLFATISTIFSPSRSPVALVDGVLTIAWSLWLLVAVIAWLLILGPIQYLLHLVTGAPARLLLTSSLKTWFVTSPRETRIITGPASASPPENATEAGFYAKPVTLTTTLDSVVVWALSWAVDRLAG